MIKINFICIGTLKEAYLKSIWDEYAKRLKKYTGISVYEIKETPFKNLNPSIVSNVLASEGKSLLSYINKDDYVILLDLHGKEISSEKFASKLNEAINTLRGSIDIVIGGPLGLDDELRKRANFCIKLSDFTFTHQMCRVLIIEQIYRAFKIMNNEFYHY